MNRHQDSMNRHVEESNHTIDYSSLETIRDWVRYFVSEMNRSQVYFGHGSTQALDEAVYLIQSTLSLPLADINPFLDAKVLTFEQNQLRQCLHDRTVKRLPAPYITGQAWLTGQSFRVDPRVIIPRSFLAELLEGSLAPWLEDPEQPLKVLDLCCGSGCLGILAALALPNSTVDCVDLSKEALEVASLNVQDYELEDRVRLIESDLYTQLQGQQYDLILTNPPYVNEASMDLLPAEYLHEPRMALAGGQDGMDLIDTIVKRAPDHLKDQGMLFCELGNERPFFEARYPQLPALWLEVSAGEDQVFMLRKEDLRF